MNRAAFAQAAADASPLLPELSGFNAALRRLVVAEGRLDASTEPGPEDGEGAWSGFRTAQAARMEPFRKAAEALAQAKGRAEARLGRSLTEEEARLGFGFSNRRGFPGAPVGEWGLKPGRTIGAPPRVPPAAPAVEEEPVRMDFGAAVPAPAPAFSTAKWAHGRNGSHAATDHRPHPTTAAGQSAEPMPTNPSPRMAEARAVAGVVPAPAPRVPRTPA